MRTNPRTIVRCLAVVLLSACSSSKPAVTVPAPVAEAPAPPPEAPAPAAPPAAQEPAAPTLRLPRTFLPTAYAARLEIDPAQSGFRGAIQIAGALTERSQVIWLNARKLTVGKAVVRTASGEIALAARLVGDDFLELRAAAPIEPGGHTIEIEYTGDYEALATAGVFKQTVNGAPYIYTQFEALFARRAFPCFDEPDNKVPWQLTLDVPKQLVAVSNTAQASEEPLPGDKKRVAFKQTKPLPSYLVAFGVGPFEIVDAGKTKRGTPIRIITLAKRAADAAFAAKTSAGVVELLEDYFGTPYPYDKLDQLTIPITVGFGAMENAGLITYSESSILHDAKAAKSAQLRWISICAHEVAHQWFGNLVTMKFWDDIWLNEGFASWVARKVVARYEPKWREDQAVLNTRDNALDNDSLVTARQIRQPIVRQDDINTAFDRITYDKGASVLAMFESYLGVDTFQKGIRDYLASRAWGNATSSDFAAAISNAAGKDIGAAFATFLEQAGTPEITAMVSCEAGKAQVALAQQRYVPPGAATPPATKPWIVPVCVVYDHAGKRAEACTLLEQPTGAIALETQSCPRWMMPNVNGRGYYRNVYTPAQITALRDEAWAQLSWTERRVVFREARDAASTGRLPLALALSMVPKMIAGNDRFTIGPAVNQALGLARFVPPALRPKYEAWLRATFGAAAAKAGVMPSPNDTLDRESTRSDLLRAVAWRGRDPKLVAEAVRLADKWRDLPQSIRGAVLQIGVDAKPELFERVMKDVVTEPDRSKRTEMLRALATVRDPARQTVALGLVLDKRLDPRETVAMLYGGGGGGPRGGGPTGEDSLAAAQAFFRANQEAIMKTLPQDSTSGSLARMSVLFTSACDPEQREEITAYVKKTFGGMTGGGRAIAQSLEQMDQCIERRKIIEPEIHAWLTGARTAEPETAKADGKKPGKPEADTKAAPKKPAP